MTLEVTRDEGQNATPSVRSETANLNMVSMKFEVFPLLRKFSEGKFDLKPEFLVGARAS
ncbi:MAG: hypothetical protein OXI66_10915 [Boseongicola sp.]|nr:hypothetical protein [Boseongicola sp.]MDE0346272.1 hypothetical protein [Boseongicola sp.]